MIVRGTTPTMTFELPFETNKVAIGFVIVGQQDATVIEKEFSSCKCNGLTVSASFTQEETLRLSADQKAKINLVMRTQGGERHESQPIFEDVMETSKKDVI